jgi:hypothetical protein
VISPEAVATKGYNSDRHVVISPGTIDTIGDAGRRPCTKDTLSAAIANIGFRKH